MIQLYYSIYCALYFYTITSPPSQIIRHQILEVRDPCSKVQQSHKVEDAWVPASLCGRRPVMS